MKLGEAITETAELILDNPEPAAPVIIPSSIKGCCFFLQVLAETSITSGETGELRNDKRGLIEFFSTAFSGATMELQKDIDGTWTDIVTLNDNTYGTFYGFGFYENIFKEKAIGYLLDWQKVLVDVNLGEGKYRVKFTGTGTISADVDRYSFEYCLSEWTQSRENETIKLEWNMTGRVGDPRDDKKQRDFGTLNWYDQIRLPGYFGFPIGKFETEDVHYQSEFPGFGEQVKIKDEYFDEYTARIYPIPYFVHEFLKHDFMLSYRRRISDFNTDNPVHYIRKFVRPVTNWEPNWYFGAKEASVELKFNDLFQNKKHKYS